MFNSFNGKHIKKKKNKKGFDDNSGDEFWNLVNGGKPGQAPPDVAPNDEEGANEEKKNESVEPTINQVSDESGDILISQFAKGKKSFKRSLLKSDDAFIVDIGYSIYVWIGNKATKQEQREAMKYAVTYCMESGRSTNIPIVRIFEGRETEEFLSAFENGGDDDEKLDDNVKRSWQLNMHFDGKTQAIALRVTEGRTKQEFGKDIKSGDVGGKEIVEVYKELVNQINSGNVKYEYNNGPPLVVNIDSYTFSCPGM